MKKRLLELFLVFMRIGAFTFGGGYAMISIIEDICVEKKKWITSDEMGDMTVVAESTPGPIAINCATYVGYKLGGFLGALAATLGVVLPSFIVIFIISSYLDNFLDIEIVANAFKGIKVAVGLLILSVEFGMAGKLKNNVLGIVIMLLSLIIMAVVNFFSLSFSSVVIMLLSAAVSLAFCVLLPKIKGKGDKAK